MRYKGTPLQRLRTEIYVLTHNGGFVNQTQFATLVGMNSSGIGLIEQGGAAPRESRYVAWAGVLTGEYPGAFTASDMSRLVPVARRMVIDRRNARTAMTDADRQDLTVAASQAEIEANRIVDEIKKRIEQRVGVTAIEAVG